VVKVLVVDDAAANRLVLSALLKRIGHVAVTAGNAAEARQVFASETPSAVLTDLHLGDGEDGVSLAASLRRMPDGAAVRIALMSADAFLPAVADGVVDAVLEKPVLLEDLVSFLGEKVQ